MTGEPVAFTVRRVSAVAETDGGRNTFRVEGALDGAPASLRPGMEGGGQDRGRAAFARLGRDAGDGRLAAHDALVVGPVSIGR